MKTFTRGLRLFRQRLLPLLVACILAWSGFLHPAAAQSATIRFDTLSVEDGLSQSTVRAIVQDAQGFLWFGTDDGLNQYDGYAFTLYKHDSMDSASLADNAISALFRDSRGILWVGTASGLDRFDAHTKTFQHVPGLDGMVHGITEDAQNRLWIATDNGLVRAEAINAQQMRYISYLPNPAQANALQSTHIFAVWADQKGSLWVGSDQGLDNLNIQTGQFTHYQHSENDPTSLGDNHVLSVVGDRTGTLWVGTESGGLNRFHPDTATFSRYTADAQNPYAISGDQVHAILEDQKGQLWVGGRSGLNRYQRADAYFTHYSHDAKDVHSLSSDNILCLYTDRAGVVWIGTFGGGVSKIIQNNGQFLLYQHHPSVPNSLNSDVVYAITEDRAGVVWVGTLDGGLNRMDPELGTFSAYVHNPYNPGSLSSDDVRAILEDRRGRLWVGTNGGGLDRRDSDTSGFAHYVHNAQDAASLPDDHITVLVEDRRGSLWVGTHDGLARLENETGRFQVWRTIPSDVTSLSDNTIRAITEDHNGVLWVGTAYGLNRYSPDSGLFQRYFNDPKDSSSLSDNRVLSILETSDGSLWVGTQTGGLNRLNPVTQTFAHFTQRNGLAGDTIYGILVDRSGFLWLSTNHGLSRFDPKSATFRNYDRSDGLQSFEFSPGAYDQDSHGRMYFGGIQGFNAFDPPRIQDNPLPPPVVITAFKKFNQTEREDLTNGEQINLTFQDNFISFEFAALDYSTPAKNQYAYKLDGFDKDWIYAGTRRYASYTNLRSGSYVFRVVGSNQDGVWNAEGANVKIFVAPPIWERWWFIGAVGLALSGAAWGLYRIRVRDIEGQNTHLEDQIHERTQEIERRSAVAESLRDILAILNSNRSLEESLDAIIQQMVTLMGARAAVIFRWNEAHFVSVVATNLRLANQAHTIKDLPEWLTRPILEGQVLSIPDMLQLRSIHPRRAASPFEDYAALLAQPVVVNDQIDGGLVLLYDWPHPFSEEDRQMAASFANHAALAIANAQMRSQSEEIAVLAERNRLARDLHDAVTQTLFATSLIAEVLPRLWERSPEIGKQKVGEIRELTRGALAEMRTLLMELRPSALTDVPLPDLLQQLAEAFTGRARVPCKLDVDRTIDLPVHVKIGMYRIAQEALNNVQKHARASAVSLCLERIDQRIELTIHDDGLGFAQGEKAPNHLGLHIMQERAQSFDGQFTMQSQPGAGTTICISWEAEPLRAIG